MDRVKDRVCIVTGAAGGIGLAIAKDLLKEGAKVALADVSEKIIEVGTSVSQDGNAMGVIVDVTDRSSVQQMIQKTVAKFGRLDVIFNNAGVNKPLMFLDVTEDNWDFIMKVNGLGVLLCTQEAAKQMIRQGNDGKTPGKIINTASIASREAWDDIAPYASSKFAVVAITQSAAKALAQYNITVNAFAPGVVGTDMWEQLDKDLLAIGKGERLGQAREDFSRDIIRGRIAMPEDIVGTTTFLASDDSNYMTANVIMIDGGKVLR